VPYIFDGQEVLELRGEWNLVLNKFLDYDQVLKEQDQLKVNVPGNWDKWTSNDSGARGMGFGTYYNSVVLTDSIRGDLSIEVSEVSLAYRLFINDELVGQVGTPGENNESTSPKIDHQIFDFDHNGADTLKIVFHVSNFSHRSGGIWYVPKIGLRSQIKSNHDLNKIIKLLIVGSIIIGGIFQLYIFLSRRKEQFGFYFFLVCCALIMLFMSRGDMPIMDLFPNTSWQILKKMVYISLFLIVPFNGLFLRVLFPSYFHKNVINIAVFISVLLSVFTLLVPPRISHPLITPFNYCNVIFGIYLLTCLLRVAIKNEFGSRFLLFGYLTAFVAATHDVLSSRHLIDGYAVDMIHVGTVVYIFQLLIMISARYIKALEGREKLSAHLKQVNNELENTIDRRTKKLSAQNQIIEQQNETLQKVIEEKDDLMAVVAHDLKAPFDNIHSLSDLLKPNLSGEPASFNDLIKRRTIDGKNLIENLVQIKQYEQDSFQITEKQFSVVAFFNAKMKAFETIAKEKKIALKQELRITKRTLISDEFSLGRILDNLISNAIKFTPISGEVFISLKEEGGWFVFTVEDNGPGFTEQDKFNAFKKFHKLSARPTAGESSTGLGLSIAKSLTKHLGGKLELTSQEGKGATFTLSIPKKSTKI
jgi:signal transduction histidine kinase